jgi:hypothetical protein
MGASAACQIFGESKAKPFRHSGTQALEKIDAFCVNFALSEQARSVKRKVH